MLMVALSSLSPFDVVSGPSLRNSATYIEGGSSHFNEHNLDNLSKTILEARLI